MVSDNAIEVLWIEEETASSLIERMQWLNASPDFEITVCATFESGKEMIESHGDNFDLFIIDILLPENNLDYSPKPYGLDLIKLLYEYGKLEKMALYTNEIYEAILERLEEDLRNKVPRGKYLQKTLCSSNYQLVDFLKECTPKLYD